VRFPQKYLYIYIKPALRNSQTFEGITQMKWEKISRDPDKTVDAELIFCLSITIHEL